MKPSKIEARLRAIWVIVSSDHPGDRCILPMHTAKSIMRNAPL
jgi:hypothetical protein